MKKCDKCGSDKIIRTNKAKRTTGPKNNTGHRLMPKPKISYGYFYDECVCECGNTWEEKK